MKLSYLENVQRLFKKAFLFSYTVDLSNVSNVHIDLYIRYLTKELINYYANLGQFNRDYIQCTMQSSHDTLNSPETKVYMTTSKFQCIFFKDSSVVGQNYQRAHFPYPPPRIVYAIAQGVSRVPPARVSFGGRVWGPAPPGKF